MFKCIITVKHFLIGSYGTEGKWFVSYRAFIYVHICQLSYFFFFLLPVRPSYFKTKEGVLPALILFLSAICAMAELVKSGHVS